MSNQRSGYSWSSFDGSVPWHKESNRIANVIDLNYKKDHSKRVFYRECDYDVWKVLDAEPDDFILWQYRLNDKNSILVIAPVSVAVIYNEEFYE